MNIMILLLDVNGKQPFQLSRIRACLEGLPGIHDWREGGKHSVFECEFDFNGDSTITRVGKELLDVSIWGLGDASLKASLEIQRCYGEEIHALSEAPRFDINLGSIASVAEMRMLIEACESAHP